MGIQKAFILYKKIYLVAFVYMNICMCVYACMYDATTEYGNDVDIFMNDFVTLDEFRWISS